MVTFQLFVAILIFIWFYILWSRREFYKLILKIPGPLGYPFIGVALKLLKREDVLETFEWHQRVYGNTFYAWLGPYPFLVVSEPQIAQDIFTSPNCVNKGIIYFSLDAGIGRGLFSLRNPEWSVHRKLLNPAFAHKVLLTFMPTFNRKVNGLLKTFDELSFQGEVELSQIVQEFTLDIATETTMGSVNNISAADHRNLLTNYQRLLENMTEMSFTPWLRSAIVLFLSGRYKSYVMAKNGVQKFISGLLHEKLQSQSDGGDAGQKNALDQNVFINRAIDLLKRNEFTLQNVLDESNVIVFGAFETTANTIIYTLMLLAMFPEYQEKAFEELQALFPDLGDFEVTYTDTQNMVYMDMVLNEGMRVMAPVPLVVRETSAETPLSNGIVLPKGVQVCIDMFNMHRRKDIWGPEAHLFNPDNFLPSNMEGKHPYCFIPFTKGARNCIGWKYALISLKVALAKLLRNYRFTTSFKFEDLHFVEDITIKLKTMPLIQIHKRNS